MNLNSQNIKTLSNYFRDKPVIKAYLFGSQVRNQLTKDSDIDILVKFSRRKSLLDIVKLEREISTELGKKVDLLTEAAISPYLRDRILSELKVIYEN